MTGAGSSVQEVVGLYSHFWVREGREWHAEDVLVGQSRADESEMLGQIV